jgi:ubiquinone/menaquinone biosynthesis C-methylase UbiE
LSQLGNDVYLLDYSRESLRLVCSSVSSPNVKLILADGQNCPFNDNTFDIVFHQGLLEHFSSPYRLLSENLRILKKGGFLVVDVPQTFHIYTIFKHILILFDLWFGGWERQFTRTSLMRLLKRFGFRPIHSYGDWSRPGIFYKILREVLKKIKIRLPMYPKFLGLATEEFYKLQEHLRKKKLFLYTVLSIGVIAQKC